MEHSAVVMDIARSTSAREKFHTFLCFSHQKLSMPEAYRFGVCDCERVCVSRKPCEHHISKTSEGNFTQFWSLTDVFGCIDVLIRFLSQRSRPQQADA